MLIFDEFYQAFLTAISDYQEKETQEGKKISGLQHADLQAFQGVLNTAKQTHRNAAFLREELFMFLETLKPSLLAKLFPTLFGTILHQIVQGVLDKPQYRETILVIREQVQLGARQRRIEAYLEGGNVTQLINQLEKQESELEASQKAYADLTRQHQKTQTENDRLKAENAQLQQRIADLEKTTGNKDKRSTGDNPHQAPPSGQKFSL